MSAKRRDYCTNGHVLDTVGRVASGRCRACHNGDRRAARAARRPADGRWRDALQLDADPAEDVLADARPTDPYARFDGPEFDPWFAALPPGDDELARAALGLPEDDGDTNVI